MLVGVARVLLQQIVMPVVEANERSLFTNLSAEHVSFLACPGRFLSYFEQVLRTGYGIKRHPLFFLMKSFWTRRTSQLSDHHASVAESVPGECHLLGCVSV
mgnify:CR=1 FL=1